MRKLISIIPLILVSGLLPRLLVADLLTREQAIANSLSHNPELSAFHEQVYAAGARSKTAAGARLPVIGLSYRARRSNNPLDAFADLLNTRNVTNNDFLPESLNHPDPSDIYMAELSMRLPLYTGGRLKAEIANAEANETGVQLQYQYLREITVYRTIEAFVRVQAANQVLEIFNDAVNAAQGHADTTARLVRQGRIVESDKLTAQINLSAINAMYEKGKQSYWNAIERLALVMGLAPTAGVELPRLPTAGVVVPSTDRSLADLVANALERRKDLRAMHALHDGAQAEIDAAKARRRPQIDLVAGSQWYDDELSVDNRSWSVMSTVSADLYRGGQNKYRITAAKHQAKEVAHRVRLMEQQIRNDVQEAYHGVRTAERRVVISHDNVALAQENVRLVKRRYGQGRTILIDLLQAERSLVEARNEELSAHADLELSRTALQLAQGILNTLDL